MEEYILEQLSELERENENDSISLQELVRSENNIIDEIKIKTESIDVDLEVFSPRQPVDQTKEQISSLNQTLEEIRFKEVEIRNRIEQNQVKIEKFHTLLLDARKQVDIPSISIPSEQDETSLIKDIERYSEVEIEETKEKENTVDIPKTEEKASRNLHSEIKSTEVITKQFHERVDLENILQRVEKSLNYLYADKLKCKNELKNLRYYLRALIAQEKERK